jgi:hypothetical protein
MKVSVLYIAGNFLTKSSKISSEEGVCTCKEKWRQTARQTDTGVFALPMSIAKL